MLESALYSTLHQSVPASDYEVLLVDGGSNDRTSEIAGIYRKLFGNLDQDYPVSARLNETAFYIGCHPEMTDADVGHIVETFHEYFGGR